MLVFIGAVRREIAGLEPLVDDRETERYGSAIAVQGTADGRPVALVRSGIGRERSESAIRDLLLAEVRPRAIVSLGFAGGVAPDVYGGDLVVPRSIRGLDASGAPDGAVAPDPYLFDSALEALEDEFIAVHTDEVVTVPETLFTWSRRSNSRRRRARRRSTWRVTGSANWRWRRAYPSRRPRHLRRNGRRPPKLLPLPGRDGRGAPPSRRQVLRHAPLAHLRRAALGGEREERSKEPRRLWGGLHQEGLPGSAGGDMKAAVTGATDSSEATWCENSSTRGCRCGRWRGRERPDSD